MFNEKHLAIIRVALTYWDEEMAGVSKSVYQHYLNSKDQDIEFDDRDVAFTRRLLNLVNIEHSSGPAESQSRTKIVLVSTPTGPRSN